MEEIINLLQGYDEIVNEFLTHCKYIFMKQASKQFDSKIWNSNWVVIILYIIIFENS